MPVRAALFTDSAMLSDGPSIHPIRDQFVHFASGIADPELELTLVARTRLRRDGEHCVEPLALSPTLRFVRLPFYENTRAFYTRLPLIVARSLKTVIRECRRADIVVLRHHHCLAPVILAAAAIQRKPLVLYWAGPPILESARRNHTAGLSGFLARAVASLEQHLAFRSATGAVHHLFVDRDEWALMGSPTPVDWVVPTLISLSDVTGVPLRLNTPARRILFAGRITRHKGVFDLLCAFERLADLEAEATLLFAGDGEDLQHLSEAAARSSHADRVEVLGGLGRTELAEVMGTCDIFCLPSYAEGLPKVLWEAWAADMSVVMTNVGSVRYFVENRRNGLIIKPGDTEGLQAALATLVRDESLHRRLARAGRATARGYSQEHSTARLRSVLTTASRDGGA